jgi:arginine:ornithine antiporter / lysine permease
MATQIIIDGGPAPSFAPPGARRSEQAAPPPAASRSLGLGALSEAGFGDGNTIAGIAGVSVLLWLYHALLLQGVKTPSAVNVLVTIAKLVPLALFVVFVAPAFQAPRFSLDFWGNSALGPVFDQGKSTMLVTVWAFIGIEGAAVFAGHARSSGGVGRATVIGFALTIVLYMAITLLALGEWPLAALLLVAALITVVLIGTGSLELANI